jgi:hypothetical protein
MRAAAVAFVLAAGVAGCEAVPALTFVDAATEPDAAGDSGVDAGGGDAFPADATPDAAEQNTCPDDAAPPPANVCCPNNLPCSGCSAQGSDCSKCANAGCSANEACCFKQPNATCVLLGTPCP